MSEPVAQRWKRRALSIPAMLGAAAAAILAAPVALPVTVVADLMRGRRPLPNARVYLFVLQYLFNDSAEIIAAPVFWAQAGFGAKLGSPASIERHERLQRWSIKTLQRRADRLLGLRLTIDAASEAALTPGPTIVLSRHVSLFDASLPGVLCQAQGMRVRGVIMDELLADPGFDLIFGRLGSIFIPRDDGPAALEAVRRMTEGAEPNTAFIIFPEGRLYSEGRRERALQRLAERDPERAERLAGLGASLPPRPGGTLALLEALPQADVVVIDHRGLEPFPRLVDLAAAVPVNEPVQVIVERIDRSGIPTDPADQVRWLDELWLRLGPLA